MSKGLRFTSWCPQQPRGQEYSCQKWEGKATKMANSHLSIRWGPHGGRLLELSWTLSKKSNWKNTSHQDRWAMHAWKKHWGSWRRGGIHEKGSAPAGSQKQVLCLRRHERTCTRLQCYQSCWSHLISDFFLFPSSQSIQAGGHPPIGVKRRQNQKLEN